MAEARTAEPGDRARSPGRRFAERLSEARWLIAALAAVLLLLFAADALSLGGAAFAFAAIAVLIGLMPLAVPSDRPASPAEAVPAIWPETGIKLFAEALPDPCFVLDRRGIVRYANSRAAAAFPIRPGEPLAFRLRVPDLIAAFERVAGGGSPERVEFSERVPTERWFAAWFAGLDSRSVGDFVVLILDDLSERRRLDRIRVDFVANASHELRTPLASLAGFIETLQGPARDDPAARERFLSIMHDQATRMSRLIADLLSLSRIELKVHVRPSDTVDAVSALRHVVDALEPLARELGVAIEANLPGGPAMVVGERDELIQVFENLIENAIKYGQSGKRVVVTVEPATAASGPVVSVRDFGPGIAEEHLPRLTERFYRVDVEASRQHRGTGLGLAIVKHILARHGARMAIDSRPGEGALFSVTFPQGESGSEIEVSKN
jgi:two-component system, OmpR family, phosphate regulon sensor histidine kinase PhoR